MNADFANLPDSLAGDENRKQRERLAQHFVQRRRADIRHYLKTDTAFPDRLEKEETYQLGKTSPYMLLLLKLLKYAREVVKDSENLSKVRQRVRWWAALWLAAIAGQQPRSGSGALRSKSKAITAETAAHVDEISRPLDRTKTPTMPKATMTLWSVPIRQTWSKAMTQSLGNSSTAGPGS